MDAKINDFMFWFGKKIGVKQNFDQKMSCPKGLWPGQKLPEQMSQGQLLAFTDGPTNLAMKFCKDLISKSWDSGPQTLYGRVACRPV